VLSKAHPELNEAVVYLKSLSDDERVRWQAEVTERARRDAVAMKLYDMRIGREEGRAEAKHEAAVNMIKLGAENVFIAKATGMEIDKVEELRRSVIANEMK